MIADHYAGQSGQLFDGPECRIPGCVRPRGRRRWCPMHLTRYKRHGDPMRPGWLACCSLYVDRPRKGSLKTNGYRVVGQRVVKAVDHAAVATSTAKRCPTPNVDHAPIGHDRWLVLHPRPRRGAAQAVRAARAIRPSASTDRP